MLIDTHAHLFTYESSEELLAVLSRAKEAGVLKFVVPGLNLATSEAAINLAKKYPELIYAAVGIHPEEMSKMPFHEQIEGLKKLIEQNREYVVAVGEIGTDANCEELEALMQEQVELFVAQAKLALDYDLPLIIHTRKSLPVTLHALDLLPKMPRGVFHSFSHDLEGMEEIVKRGFLFGFAGSVSYSKRIQKVAEIALAESFLLETDTPYLPRDFLKEPSSVTMLAKIIANLRGENVNTISDITTKNARKLFGI